MIATEGEMKKVNWSTRREILGSTWIVIGLTAGSPSSASSSTCSCSFFTWIERARNGTRFETNDPERSAPDRSTNQSNDVNGRRATPRRTRRRRPPRRRQRADPGHDPARPRSPRRRHLLPAKPRRPGAEPAASADRREARAVNPSRPRPTGPDIAGRRPPPPASARRSVEGPTRMKHLVRSRRSSLPAYREGMNWFVLRVASNKENYVRETLLRKVQIEGCLEHRRRPHHGADREDQDAQGRQDRRSPRPSSTPATSSSRCVSSPTAASPRTSSSSSRRPPASATSSAPPAARRRWRHPRGREDALRLARASRRGEVARRSRWSSRRATRRHDQGRPVRELRRHRRRGKRPRPRPTEPYRPASRAEHRFENGGGHPRRTGRRTPFHPASSEPSILRSPAGRSPPCRSSQPRHALNDASWSASPAPAGPRMRSASFSCSQRPMSRSTWPAAISASDCLSTNST